MRGRQYRPGRGKVNTIQGERERERQYRPGRGNDNTLHEEEMIRSREIKRQYGLRRGRDNTALGEGGTIRPRDRKIYYNPKPVSDSRAQLKRLALLTKQ